MEILHQGDKGILALLSIINYSDEPYQLSSFVIRNETQDGSVLFSTLSGEVVLLSQEEMEAIDALPSRPGHVLSKLKQHGFIVPQFHDEIERVEQLRRIYITRREADGIITHYNVLPTTDCNARCFYCYESDFRHVSMSMETADKLVDYIIKHHGGRKIRISWYGGEPTLGKQRIDYICKELSGRGIAFESHMVSNAFLFDYDLVQHAKNEWCLDTIQITLDGTEKVYNKTKAYVGVHENAYERVIRNIRYFLDAKIHVNIRLNLDDHNGDDLSVLINDLTAMFHGEKYLAIYVRKLRENVGFSPIRHDDAERTLINQKYAELRNQLELNGWSQIWKFSLPKFKVFSCMADDPYTIQCTPDGLLGKCEDRIFEKTVGSLKDGITDQETVKWWRQRILHEECVQCALYPSCTHLLKHCPVRPNECPILEKQQRIRMSHKMIADIYENWRKGNTVKPDEGDSSDNETGGLVL